MLNGSLKDEALDKLKAAEESYNSIADTVKDAAMNLLQLRHSSSHVIIDRLKST